MVLLSTAIGILLAACGASKEMKAAYADMKTLAGEVHSAFTTFFGANKAILNSITSALSPIVAAGPSQQGFSDKQLATMNAASTDAIAKQQRNAQIAAGARASAGNDFIPSGATNALQTSIDVAAGEQRADATRQNMLAGFEAGRQNFWNATQGLAQAPGMLENPVTSAATPAINANQQQFGQAEKIKAAGGWWKPLVGGIVGGAASALTGGVSKIATAGLGKVLPTGGGGGNMTIPASSPNFDPNGMWG